MQAKKYPHSRKVDHVDEYYGVRVQDPYRWLEDDRSPETQDWVTRQNQLTFEFLESIPEREKIHQRLTELWDYAKVSAPLKRGGSYFQLRNSGLQNQDVLYVMETPKDEGRILLDPNRFSDDGTVALTAWDVSKDGKFIAYATSVSGSDWLTWRIRRVDDGEDLGDVIEWSKFSRAAWLPDNSAFYYSAYHPPQEGQTYSGVNYYQKLYLHRLGTPQSEDTLIYERNDQKEWGFDGQVSDDGRYLIIHVWQGTDRRNRLFYQDLKGDGEIVELISELEAGYHFVGHDSGHLYFRTDLEAPRGRLISIALDKPAREHWETVIPESNDILELVKFAGNQFVALYLVDAYHQIRRFDMQGDLLGEIPLPGIGSILSLNGNLSLFGSPDEDELFFAYHSFVHPPTVFRYVFSQDDISILNKPDVNFDFS
ncbi:MAG: S9 family peptidase, partial [Anaerolineales bacterium]